jgi:hypothetical protein
VDEEAAILAEIKQLGETEVRQLLATNQFTWAYHEPALRWIEELDRAAAEESERRRDASQAEETEIARSVKDAAWAAARAAERAAIAAEKAKTRATTALIIAAISIVATLTGIFIVHQNSIIKIDLGTQHRLRTEISPCGRAPSKLAVLSSRLSALGDASGRSLLQHGQPRGTALTRQDEAQSYRLHSA